MVIKWYIKFYHRLMIYIPFFIIVSLILFIYTMYNLHFLLVLIKPTENRNLFPLLLINNYSSYNANALGVILCFGMNWLICMMLISMFRAAFMDPGYLPNPLDFEYNLIRKNLDFPDKRITLRAMKTETVGDESIHLIFNKSMNQSAGEITDNENLNLTINRTKYDFLRDFSKFINEAPLSTSEFAMCRRNLEKYLSHASAQQQLNQLDFSNLSVEEKLNLNYDDIWENYKGADLTKIPICSTCLRWKVERAHHCRQCGKCVLRMDHHCPWLSNCIGFKNYKFFCLTVIYGLQACITVFMTFWQTVLAVNIDESSSIYLCITVTLTYILNFGLLCFLTYLFIVNWTCVLNNQTIIERSDKERFSSKEVTTNYYDLGYYKNFTAVFGKNPLLWFLPISPNYKGEGIIYEY